MVYVRLPRPAHLSVPRAAHMVRLACINALFLSAKNKEKLTGMSTSSGVKMRKEPL